MNLTNNSNIEKISPEPPGLRILRILTVLMTIVMIFGFIIIVSLLSVAIKKNITSNQNLELAKQFFLTNDDFISSITYSSDYTILLLTNDKNVQVLRVISNKSGKILSDTLISDLVDKDSGK